jgi:hypothetical protein
MLLARVFSVAIMPHIGQMASAVADFAPRTYREMVAGDRSNASANRAWTAGRWRHFAYQYSTCSGRNRASCWRWRFSRRRPPALRATTRGVVGADQVFRTYYALPFGLMRQVMAAKHRNFSTEILTFSDGTRANMATTASVG